MAHTFACQQATLNDIKNRIDRVASEHETVFPLLNENWIYDGDASDEDYRAIWQMEFALDHLLGSQGNAEQSFVSDWRWKDIAAVFNKLLSDTVPVNYEGVHYFAFSRASRVINRGPMKDTPQYDDIFDTYKLQLRIYFNGPPSHQEMPDNFYRWGYLNGCTGIMDGRSRLSGANPF